MERCYNLNGVKLGVYYDADFDTIEVFQFGERENYNEYLHSEKLKMDNDGRKYFHFNEMKIYLDDYEYIPFNELIKQFDNGEKCGTREFVNSALKAGVENIIIEYPLDCCDFVIGGMGVCSGRRKMTKCKITERRYRIVDGYKIELVAESPDHEGEILCHRSFYLSDFLSLMAQKIGKFIPVVSEENKGDKA